MACEKCGCEGFHACIGFKPQTPTKEQEESLRLFFERFEKKQEDLSPELNKLLNDNLSDLYE